MKWAKMMWAIMVFPFPFCVACNDNPQYTDSNLLKAEAMLYSNPDSALVFLNSMAADSIIGAENRANHKLLLTIANDRAGLPHKSLDNIITAKDYYETHQSSDSLLGVTYFYLGRVYEDLGQPGEALESYLKAENYLENLNNSYWLGRLFYNIGHLYHYDEDYYHASQFLEKSARHFVLINDSLNSAHVYNLMGSNHLLLGDHINGLRALEQAKHLYMGLGQKEGIMSTVIAIASIYLEELGNVPLAELTLSEAHRDFNDGIIPLNHYPLVSQIEAEKGNYLQAINYLQEYINCHSGLGIEEQSAFIYLISHYYQDLGQYQVALDHLEEYASLMDTVYQEWMAVVLQEVEKKHEKQELENEYRAYRTQMTHRIIISTLILYIIILLLISEIRRRRKKNLNLQADLDGLRSQMSDFDDLKERLSVVLNKQTEKETRLQEVLTNKMLHVQKLVNYLFLYENNPDEFKKKVRTAVVQAEKDEYFGELHEIVNDKFCGVVEYLKKLYPTLTNDELNLCCLVCFGFNNNQISILFGYTNANSIFNKRHKVRKKMGLWPTYESLETYLSEIITELKNGTI